MSEKRFYRASVCGDDGLYDKEDGCIIVNVNSNIDLNDNWNTVVDLLNEQQAIIRRDETSIKTMMSNMKKLEEENEQLRQSVEYWQKKYEEGTETFQIN